MFKQYTPWQMFQMGAGAPFPFCAKEDSASAAPVLTYKSSSIFRMSPSIKNADTNLSSLQERIYLALTPASATSGVHNHAVSSAVHYIPSVVSISGTMRGARANSGGYLGRQVLVDVGQ